MLGFRSWGLGYGSYQDFLNSGYLGYSRTPKVCRILAFYIIVYCCSYKPQENIKHIIFIMVLRG